MSRNSRRAKRRVFEQLESRCLLSAGPPDAWEIRGIGGGGAMFSPSFSPHDDQMYVVSDMSNLFRSDDLGASWEMYPSNSIRVNREHYVRFTSDPNVLYMSGFRGTQWGYPAYKSIDGGVTWVTMPDAAADSYALFADYDNPQRVVVGTWNAMYLSTDGGVSWARKYQTDDQDRGLHLAGAFFDGNQIFVATNKGLLVSTNGGADFSVSDVGGIPEEEGYMSFAGAKVGDTRRFFAVTSDTHLFNGILAEGRYDRFANVYVIDWGQAAWSRTATELSSPIAFVEMARNNIDVAYLAGKHQWWYPHVYKTTDGGSSWSNTFQYFQNANIQTGWLGDGGKFGWGWAGPPVGLAVSPTDANKVATTDYMSFHVSTDGGSSWRQTYTSPSHAAGEPITSSETYQSIGLEVTSSWDLTWATPDQLIASYTDISGLRSDDGGANWSFDYTGHTLNTMYHSLQHSNGNLYAATSSVHDLYIWGWTADDPVDGKENWPSQGHVLYSTDNGKNWQMLFDADNPVIWLAEDPNNVNRLYASVVHSQHGGIYRSDNIQAGQASTWTRLAAPPRTQGHPLTIQVLNDGTLVCTYGAHSLTPDQGDFQPRSGVFVSTDGGQSWIDRSDPNMLYWTWDLVVDPYDPVQDTWYVGVWDGWGTAAGKGGLYRTNDRGQTWTRLVAGQSVHSVTISPTDRDVMVYTTAGQGLWYTANATAANPAFTRVDSFPFAHPTRVFYNPHDVNEIWVTTFGNGMYVGRTSRPTDIAGRVTGSGHWWIGESTGREFQNEAWGRWASSVNWVDVAVGDFTGNGLDDIVGRVQETGDWWLAVNDGSGGFTNQRWGRWSTNVDWLDVLVGDFTGDGRTDIAGRVASTGDWWVAKSTGTGFVSERWGRWSPNIQWKDVLVGNFDGDRDGKVEIVGRVASTGDWWVARSNESGNGFTNERWGRWSANTDWLDVLVGDFNGDGRDDLVGRVASTGDWWVARSNESGNGFTNERWGRWSAHAHWLDILVGDFSGDGRDDLVGRVASTGDWWVARSNETGSGFTNERWGRWSANADWLDVLVGDFSGDGRDDLAGRVASTGDWWVARSNESGSGFTNERWGRWSAGSDTWTDVLVGNFASAANSAPAHVPFASFAEEPQSDSSSNIDRWPLLQAAATGPSLERREILLHVQPHPLADQRRNAAILLVRQREQLFGEHEIGTRQIGESMLQDTRRRRETEEVLNDWADDFLTELLFDERLAIS